jgi:hypothetical protein
MAVGEMRILLKIQWLAAAKRSLLPVWPTKSNRFEPFEQRKPPEFLRQSCNLVHCRTKIPPDLFASRGYRIPAIAPALLPGLGNFDG